MTEESIGNDPSHGEHIDISGHASIHGEQDDTWDTRRTRTRTIAVCGVCGIVPVCLWKGVGWFVPLAVVRWLAWAGMRKMVDGGDCGRARFDHRSAFGSVDRVEKAVGRAVMLHGHLIHVFDVESVILALIQDQMKFV